MEGGLCNKVELQRVFVKSSKLARRRRLEVRRLKTDSVSPLKRPRNPDESSNSLPSSSDETSGGIPNAIGGVRVSCLSHGAVSLIGRRREMEDAVTVAPGFAVYPEEKEAGEAGMVVPAMAYDFFGVYDGHGGARVAEACRERLHVVLAEELAAAGWPKAEGSWREAMEASFARVDGEVLAAAAEGEIGTGDIEAAGKTVGSTAVVAVVGPRRIVVANCGDSRAVLSRAGVAVPLSSDHKPDRPDEMERVEAAGGRVINWDGYRVLGVLATSRSIGDHYFKPYVTSEPEVTVTDRTGKDEFLVLGSDGLWDVVSNEAACKIVRQCLNGQMARMFPGAVNGCTASEAAAVIAELAICRGSKDNISVIVVELKKLGDRRPDVT